MNNEHMNTKIMCVGVKSCVSMLLKEGSDVALSHPHVSSPHPNKCAINLISLNDAKC